MRIMLIAVANLLVSVLFAQSNEEVVALFKRDTALVQKLFHFSGGLVEISQHPELCSKGLEMCFCPKCHFAVDSFAVDSDGEEVFWIKETKKEIRSGPYWAPKDLRLRRGDRVWVVMQTTFFDGRCYLFVYLTVTEVESE
jgi:hypothetical protein